MPSDQSMNLFQRNFLLWKIIGIWGGRVPSKYYKCYTFIILFVIYFCYNIIWTVSLIYTPRVMELILREIIFYFTEMVVAAKIFTVLLLRDDIYELNDIIDSDEFLCDYQNKDGALYKMHLKYRFCWKLYIVLCHIVLVTEVFAPFLVGLFRGTEWELPVCQYYFLSEETRQSYFFIFFFYQSLGLYVQMLYNVTTDTHIAGLLLIPIIHLRILNYNLTNLKLTQEETNASKETQDKISRAKLNNCLRHYDTILKYCNTAQIVLSVELFILFGVASLNICVIMCASTMTTSSSTTGFLGMYLLAMSFQLFVPCRMGTQLAHESEEILFAAYNCEWIPRSESFKRSLKLMMTRARTPITITGLQMFPVSLITFSSIMKTAYSLYTLLRNSQEG